MDTNEMRQMLHKYVENADESQLDLLLFMMTEQTESEADYVIDQATIAIYQRRLDDYLCGKTEALDAEEALIDIENSLRKR